MGWVFGRNSADFCERNDDFERSGKAGRVMVHSNEKLTKGKAGRLELGGV